MRALEAMVHRAGQNHSTAGLLLLDVDDFHRVNRRGTTIGDGVLLELAKRVRETLRPIDRVFRIGDDEFAALLPELKGRNHALLAATGILAALEPPFKEKGQLLEIRASIGVSLFPTAAADEQELLRDAARAMRQVKADGGGRYAIGQGDHTDSPPSLGFDISELRVAIDEDRLELVYQPIVDTRTRKVARVEALIRWPHPNLGLLDAETVVTFAECGPIIHDLTMWVLRTALHQHALWMARGIRSGTSINLSARNLEDPDLPHLVRRELETWHVAPQAQMFELTETAMMRDSEEARRVLQELADLGCRLCIDDFGRGYSSLSYLHRLPVHELKMDKAFVTDLVRKRKSDMIARTIIDLARNFGLRVTAEGVEDAATLERLGEMGCDLAQGHYIGRPQRPDTVWTQSSSVLSGP